MKKILVGYIIDGKKSGIDRYLLNMLKSLENKGYQIDFLTNQIDTDLQEVLKVYGSKLYEIPSLKHPIKQIKIIKKILKENAYEIAYFNISEAFNLTGVFAAHSVKVSKMIVHSHSSGCDSNSKVKWIKVFLHKMGKVLLPRWADTLVACSDKAAEWMFPEKLQSNVIHIINGVDAKAFEFSEEVREKVRNEMKWEDKKILLHVGNFLYVKNHLFLVNLIDKMKNLSENYQLVLVGDGPLKPEIERKVEELKLQKKVQFLGIRSDVAQLFQGSDYFLLPSFFEGLPLTAVEAQVAGNVCILSDTITQDAKLSEILFYLPIDNVDLWIEKIEEYFDYKKIPFVNNTEKIIDIMEQSKVFESLFE